MIDSTVADDLRAAIRDYPDFPAPGIVFRDLMPVLADPELLARVVDALGARAERCRAGRIAAIESRGFLFGVAVALQLGLPFFPVRKGGKLPGETVSVEYDLEYGRQHLEMQTAAVERGDSVLLVDDVLATGGTAAAAAGLVERLGGSVAGITTLVELTELGGRRALMRYNIYSLLAL